MDEDDNRMFLTPETENQLNIFTLVLLEFSEAPAASSSFSSRLLGGEIVPDGCFLFQF